MTAFAQWGGKLRASTCGAKIERVVLEYDQEFKKKGPADAYQKLAISMPAALAHAVTQQVQRRRVASVSAYVARAVEEKLERDQLQEALDEVWNKQAMTQEERAWADQILRV